jgi:hypothetical protein
LLSFGVPPLLKGADFTRLFLELPPQLLCLVSVFFSLVDTIVLTAKAPQLLLVLVQEDAQLVHLLGMLLGERAKSFHLVRLSCEESQFLLAPLLVGFSLRTRRTDLRPQREEICAELLRLGSELTVLACRRPRPHNQSYHCASEHHRERVRDHLTDVLP